MAFYGLRTIEKLQKYKASAALTLVGEFVWSCMHIKGGAFCACFACLAIKSDLYRQFPDYVVAEPMLVVQWAGWVSFMGPQFFPLSI